MIPSVLYTFRISYFGFQFWFVLLPIMYCYPATILAILNVNRVKMLHQTNKQIRPKWRLALHC